MKIFIYLYFNSCNFNIYSTFISFNVMKSDSVYESYSVGPCSLRNAEMCL